VGSAPAAVAAPQGSFLGNALRRRSVVRLSSPARACCLRTGMLHISVIDTGCGISVENQKRLFTQGFNPERLQAGGGSGFGLFICEGIVAHHGGKVR